jgi:hypothetical protein
MPLTRSEGLAFNRQNAVVGIREARRLEAQLWQHPELPDIERWEAALRMKPVEDSRLIARLLRLLARWRAEICGTDHCRD